MKREIKYRGYNADRRKNSHHFILFRGFCDWNMWWVIINQYPYRNMASFQLFDLTEEDEHGRLAIPSIPESYLQRKRKLAEASTKELIAELRKRGKFVI